MTDEKPFIPRGPMEVEAPSSVLTQGDEITFSVQRDGWHLTYHRAVVLDAPYAGLMPVLVSPSTVVTYDRTLGNG